MNGFSYFTCTRAAMNYVVAITALYSYSKDAPSSQWKQLSCGACAIVSASGTIANIACLIAGPISPHDLIDLCADQGVNKGAHVSRFSPELI
jgi:hypothetical protein